ncbi:MAG: chemotaxis-specific protein-glutamate methyltransferase CheB [Pseudomonadota bacterium]|nr:chemotaxis-specific protein-glutamate methyltransferase CheB [Pseudomonadota bacterium]
MSGTTAKRIRVVIVDDSSVMRILLRDLLAQDPRIEVVGSAVDPFYAKDVIRQLRPDVVTLDVEMPRMDGVTFLGKLMRFHPVPVVMVSTHTDAGTDAALRALERGAVDVIAKPTDTSADALKRYAAALTRKIVDAAATKDTVERLSTRQAEMNTLSGTALEPMDRRAQPFARPGVRVVAMGGSTGAPQALRRLLRHFPSDTPGTLIAIHLPGRFVESFVQRLDDVTVMRTQVAQDGHPIEQGNIYLAPGDQHLVIEERAGELRCRLHRMEKVHGFRPSVDVLFDSIATLGPGAAAVLLTGMGKDGAQGLLRIHQAGGYTIAQDEASSVVWGMPGAAVAAGGAQDVVPLERIAAVLCGRDRQARQRAIA